MRTLDLDETQISLQRSVRAFCAEYEKVKSSDSNLRIDPATARDAWIKLAEVGVFEIGTAAGGGAPEVSCVMEELGAACFPGPLVATYFATQVLEDSECGAITSGERTASLSVDGLFPWASDESVLLEVDGDSAWQVEPCGPAVVVDTLGSEPWVRIPVSRLRELGDANGAIAVANIALASYLVGAALHMLETAADHARDRRQFGKPIGDFQAVGHPLAQGDALIASARSLTQLAAHGLVAQPAAGGPAAAARVAAADAALFCANACHQVCGALGFTEEFRLWAYSTRVRQWSLLSPDRDAAGRDALNAIVSTIGRG